MKGKLVEISSRPCEVRWKTLQEVLKSECQFELSYEVFKVTKENFAEVLKSQLKDENDIIKVGEDFFEASIKEIHQSSFNVLRNSVCHALVRGKNGWWPKITLDQALIRSLSDQVKSLDVAAKALVSGTHGAASQVVPALLTFGYQEIHFVGPDKAEGEKLLQQLRKVYFRTKFEFVGEKEITHRAGIYSILVNSAPLAMDDEWIEELYFFNFLKPGGVVVDMNLCPIHTPLLEEAKALNASFMSGEVIAAEEDIVLLECASFPAPQLKSYCDKLKSALEAQPFDIEPYLKRFRGRVS